MAIAPTRAARRSWTDFTDEGMEDSDVEVQMKQEIKEDKLAIEEAVVADLMDAQGEGDPTLQSISDDTPSVGSAQHQNGRCKPCAFFHTKGCQNDKACLFCHLCPPGEKSRRKRLRERMCEKLGQVWQNSARFNPVDRRLKGGHLRQSSGTSTAASSTQSTCSGWSRFSHSRQSSGSSVALSSSLVSSFGSVQEEAVVGPHSHMHQMMPVFHFAQPVMSPMAASEPVQCMGMATMDHSNSGVRPEDGASVSPNSNGNTIALAQAVPMPDQANHEWGNHPEQMQSSGGQWTGVVQYALVPVAVPMRQHDMDSSLPYGCFPQHPQAQMPVANGQWCTQVGMQYAHQPTFATPFDPSAATLGGDAAVDFSNQSAHADN